MESVKGRFNVYVNEEEEDEEIENFVQRVQFVRSMMSSLPKNPPEKAAAGEPSDQSFCEICAETKQHDQMFEIQNCHHVFCNQCIKNHIETKLNENIHTIKCMAADCEHEIDFDSCMNTVPKDLLEKWNKVICESMIPESQKFYCPFKDCSAMMVRDSEEVIRESECPSCRRLFCAECRAAPWHSGIGCEEFRAAPEGEREKVDFMLKALIEENKWNRCPRCKFVVEKISGCLHINCRCGFEFCYACGGTWSNIHGCSVRR